MASRYVIRAALAVAAGLPVALAAAGAAVADPPTASSADAVVKHLQDEGYNVQFNMPSEMQLSRCTVSGINGLTVTMAPDGNLMAMMGSRQGGNVTVDLDCPNSNN